MKKYFEDLAKEELEGYVEIFCELDAAIAIIEKLLKLSRDEAVSKYGSILRVLTHLERGLDENYESTQEKIDTLLSKFGSDSEDVEIVTNLLKDLLVKEEKLAREIRGVRDQYRSIENINDLKNDLYDIEQELGHYKKDLKYCISRSVGFIASEPLKGSETAKVEALMDYIDNEQKNRFKDLSIEDTLEILAEVIKKPEADSKEEGVRP